MKEPESGRQYGPSRRRAGGSWLLVLLLLGILLIPLAGCHKIPAVQPYLAEERDARWLKDIDYLQKTLPQVHKNLYFHLSEEEFSQQLEELKQKVPDYSDEELEIALSVILAGVGDTHTGSNIASQYRYPLELHWFKEGIYIMGAGEDYRDILYARILTLNGRKIEDAANTLRPLLAGANESWFKTQIIYYLPLPGVLKYFGLSQGDEIELGVELEDGQRRMVKMKPVSYQDYVAAETEQPAESLPLYRSRPDENYWYEYLEDEKILYFNYGSCRQMRDEPFEIFDKEFWNFVQSHEVGKLVVDIRENRGGISTILDPFIKEVKNSGFNEPGKLYVITGKDTFSSAVLNAVSLKKKTRACFVGEATGGEPNHYGEVKQFQLPNSTITVRYSTKYFRWWDEDINTLEPDKVIEETFAAYRQGRDPVLEWIMRN